ncbi:hypothetical protein AVEN_198147-1 [Araneus ventricosus]|uniref:Uncharacterized protein n=1 Tax=Araneus ventricosus TaxID=182803 RepID=A0A4Y2JE36_ARAVE|nr:hypothetical protein AVEN_198147-1 [Araneus ventricosus]
MSDFAALSKCRRGGPPPPRFSCTSSPNVFSILFTVLRSKEEDVPYYIDLSEGWVNRDFVNAFREYLTLILKKAVDMCRATEPSTLQAQVYFTEERSIDGIKRFTPSPEVNPRAIGQANKFRQPTKRQESSGRNCQYCGSRHVPFRYPAYGKQCRSFGKQNHFSRACKSQSVNQVCQNSPKELTNSANSCKYPPEQFFFSTVGLILCHPLGKLFY